MSLVEALAALNALIVIVKVATVLKSQRLWYGAVTTRYWHGTGGRALVMSLLVAAVSLAILLRELSIVQIWAATAFAMALTSLALAPFARYMREVEERWFSETNTVKAGWVPAVVWIGLSVWVLVVIAARLLR